MSWHYLAEQAAESWEGSCLDGAPSALSSLIPTAAPSCLPANAMGCSHDSRYGMTCEPSTATPGADTSMSSAADSPARTSAQPAREGGSLARKAGSGESLRGSFARYDRDMSSWRTAQISLLGASDECLETWPRWGLMLDGACYPQKILEHGICDKGSGLLPTLTVSGNYNRKGASKTSGDGLATVIRRMPTLTANDCKPAGRVEVLEYLQKNRMTTVQRLMAAVTEPEQLGGTLNPNWCEWFMGWPIGWTASEPLETDRFQQWLLGHGRRYDDEARDHK